MMGPEEPQHPNNSLAIDGTRISGQDVRNQNVTAAVAIANVVKSSLGPIGLDKMIVDDIGDVIISNDGATILKSMEVNHPAGKLLVQLADLQDQEVGDGTTSVVIIAAELLKRANELVKQNIHPSSIISGYRLACKEACKFVESELSVKVSELGREGLMNVARTSISSKIIGRQSDFFANMVVDACLRVKNTNQKENAQVPLKAINILKSTGGSAIESLFCEGFALNCTVASTAMKKCIKNAKIAVLDFNLQKMKLAQGIAVKLTDPTKLEDIRRKESDVVKERIKLILAAGANVILTSKGIDDQNMKYFIEGGAMAVRRCKKEDLRHICKATGATMLLNLNNMEGEECFEASSLGSAEEVVQTRVSDNEFIQIKGTKNSATASIILRGPNDTMLEEMERSVHDSLCAVKRAIEKGAIVPGGGAVETCLSIYLENIATTLGSREQLAIAEFADSLLVIPKVLCMNAALDATDLVARLRATHNTAILDESKKADKMTGLDLKAGVIRNNLTAGVVEPTISKIKSIQFATEAAITLLRIDDLVKLNAKEPKHQGDECM